MGGAGARYAVEHHSAHQLRTQTELRVSDLYKAFGTIVAVEDVTVAVDAGEVVGLLGRNGAGKTTTIGCISGLLRPDRGRVELGCLPIHGNQQVGVSTQEIALYPYLSAAANLRFCCQLAGVEGRQVDRRVREATDLFDLGALMHRRVRDLSGGQQRLVHVAASVVSRPRVVLLDEPTEGLDVMARRVMLAAVRELARDGAAVLYSSHQLVEVEDLCDRVLILHQGRPAAAGPISELLQHHGHAYCEVVLSDGKVIRSTSTLPELLGSLDIARVQAARVARPSLESVFVDLTSAPTTEGPRCDR